MKKQDERAVSEYLKPEMPQAQAADPDHIRPGAAGYEAIYAFWRRDEGMTFVYQGSTWNAIRDNEVMIFHRTGSMTGVDGAYEEFSVKH